jgi:microcystin-dependent protein
MALPYLSEIRLFACNAAPRGWAMCNGEMLPIIQNQALFSLLGTTYGGNGSTNFALPDLRGRVAMGWNGSNNLAEKVGTESDTVNLAQMPTHNHTLHAATSATPTNNVADPAPANSRSLAESSGQQSPGGPFSVQMYSSAQPNSVLGAGSVSNIGGSQAHNNMQPYLALNYCIALEGVFPSPN